MNTTITRNGTTYTIIPDGGARGETAWYISHPVQVGDRIEIARVAATDGSRYPSAEQVKVQGLNRYHSGEPEYTGDLVTMMIGLTAEEIVEHDFRPTGTNPTGRRISSPADAQNAIDRICNEE